MTRLAFLSILVLALSVGGCASTLGFVADTFGVEIVPETVRQKAYKAAKVAFTAWGGPLCQVGDLELPSCKAGGVQGLILIYGRLPLCSPGVVICKHQGAWDRIKDIEQRTSATLQAARPLIEAGTDDVALLMSLPETVHDAQAAINDAQKGG